MNLRKCLSVAASALALSASAFVLAAPAQAASRDGVCDSGEFCYYYNSGEAGSVSDLPASMDDYGASQPSCYEFKGAGNGQGVCVKNNAASVWNRTGKTVRVYYNSGFGGATQDFASGAKGNLDATLKNNDASHDVVTSGGGGGGGQTPTNDYDHKGQTSGASSRGFYYSQCTDFAAYRIVSRLGVSNFTNMYRGVHWGDAGTWAQAARDSGVSINKTPTVGGIAVNVVHKVGHVAYINKVYSDGSFDVEEYNWTTTNAYDTRSHMTVSSADLGFQYVIHL